MSSGVLQENPELTFPQGMDWGRTNERRRRKVSTFSYSLTPVGIRNKKNGKKLDVRKKREVEITSHSLRTNGNRKGNNRYALGGTVKSLLFTSLRYDFGW